MKKRLFISIIICVSFLFAGFIVGYTQAGGIYVTKSGFIAAETRELLDQAIDYISTGDRIALRKFMKLNTNVFYLKGGITVQLMKATFSGKVKIRPVGSVVTVWTFSNAIE